MKKTLRFSLLCLFALLGLGAQAGTITFADLELANGTQYTEPFDGDDFTVTFAGGTNDGKYYTTGTGIRVYGGGTMTITAKAGNITQIVVTYDGNYKPTTDDVVNGGSYDNTTGTWTGSANSVVFTRPSGSGHWRVQKIEVTVSTSDDDVAAPTISGTTPFYGTTEVTITNNAEGATVYYTTDETEPSASNGKEYTAPFTIDATTTVTAVAVKGGNSSAPAIKIFEKGTSVATVAELNKLADKTSFQFTGEALVVAIQGSYCYIKDETGSSLLYGSGKFSALAVGKKIAANWTGAVSYYNDLFEVAPNTLTAAEGDAVEVTYPTLTSADVTLENVNLVGVLMNVTFTAYTTSGSGRAFTITQGENTINAYNSGNLAVVTPAEGHTYNIICAVTRNKENVQVIPLKIFDNETTGINAMESDARQGAAFNAAGQQVGQGYKGLVIKNGRKYIVK